MASSIVAQRTTISATNLIMGFAKLGQAGLVVGNLLGQVISSTILIIKSIREDLRYLSLISFSGIKNVAKIYKKFPLYDSPNIVFSSFSTKGIVLVISKLFGNTIVGFYSVADRIMVTPFNFFTDAFSQAFYQKLSHTYNVERENFSNTIQQAINKMAVILTVPFIIMVISSKWFIPVILGKEWTEVYKYVYAFSPFVYISLVGSPISQTFKIINKQNVALILNFGTFILRTLSLVIPAYFFHTDIIATIVIFSMTCYLCSILSLVTINYYLKIKFSKFFTIVSIMAIVLYVLFLIFL